MAKDSSYNSFKEYPGPVKRQDAFPLDLTYLQDYMQLESYAENDPSAYVGQLLCRLPLPGEDPTLHIIKNRSGELAQIPTTEAVNELIHNAMNRSVRYMGSKVVNSELWGNEPYDEKAIHLKMSKLFEPRRYTYTDGDMYNISISDSNRNRIAHMIGDVSVKYASQGGTFLLTKCEKDANDENSYLLTLYSMPKYLNLFKSGEEDCSNLFSVSDGTNTDGSIKYCFVKFESSNLNDELPPLFPYTSKTILRLSDTPNDNDLYSQYIKDNPSILSPDSTKPNLTKVVSAKEMYEFITSLIDANNLYDINLHYTMQVRSGDNLIYVDDGMWDNVAGTVDLSQFVTKEELSNESFVFRYKEG